MKMHTSFICFLSFVILLCANSFKAAHSIRLRSKVSFLTSDLTGVKVTSKDHVYVYKDQQHLSKGICHDFIECATDEINKKGAFYCALPGGSILKMLSGLKSAKDLDWSKVFVFYLNHKCCSNSDPSGSHFKAKSIFLDAVGIPQTNVLTVGTDEVYVTSGHDTAANMYEKKIQDHVPSYFGLPRFDYILLAVGEGGRIGSLYPGRKEIAVKDRIVIPVDKRQPASVTLSLPVINLAKNIRIATYGSDKADVVHTGVMRLTSPAVHPVCGVDTAIWLVDKSAATNLQRSKYSFCESVEQ